MLYILGSIISWPLYGALIALLYGKLDVWYPTAAGLSWASSYMVVYLVQKRGKLGSDGKVLLEILHYSIFVVALSGIINFGLLYVLESYSSISRMLATICAALVAAGVGFAMSRIVLEPENTEMASATN